MSPPWLDLPNIYTAIGWHTIFKWSSKFITLLRPPHGFVANDKSRGSCCSVLPATSGSDKRRRRQAAVEAKNRTLRHNTNHAIQVVFFFLDLRKFGTLRNVVVRHLVQLSWKLWKLFIIGTTLEERGNGGTGTKLKMNERNNWKTTKKER